LVWDEGGREPKGRGLDRIKKKTKKGKPLGGGRSTGYAEEGKTHRRNGRGGLKVGKN